MTLEQQIRAQFGGQGTWDYSGVDRAAELARLLQAQGITDLSQLQGMRQATQGFAPQNTGDEAYLAAGSPTPAAFNISGKNGPIGFLGNINQDGSVDTSVARNFFDENNTIGWSSQGHGNVSYDAQFDDKGNFVGIAPRWESSSAWQDIRPFLQMAAMYAGGQLLGGGDVSAGAGAGSGAGAGTYSALEPLGYVGQAAPIGGIEAGAAGATGAGAAAAGTGAGTEGLFGTGIEFGAGLPEVAPSITGSSLLTGAAQAAGSNVPTWAKIATGLLGAYDSRNRTSTQSKEPWGPAQPFLAQQLGQGQQLSANLANEPFNPIQKQAMQQKLGLLNYMNSNVLPGLLGGLGTLNQGYQRPGGPAPRANPYSFDQAGLLSALQGQPIDWTAMNPFKKG